MSQEQYSLSKMNIQSVEDLIQPEYLQKIRDTFARSTGIQIVVGRTDPGEHLVEPELYYFCRELRTNPDFLGRCFANYLNTVEELDQTDTILVKSCHLGFWMFGAPIKVGGKALGLIGGCMVRPDEGHLSRSTCEEICQEFAYSGDREYLYQSLEEIPIYTKEQLAKTLDIFKEMASALSEVAQSQFLLKIEEAKRARLERYFSPKIYQVIQARSEDLSFTGEASILFSDIRDFTSKSERMSPESVVRMLNEYFEEMVDAVFHYDGTLDKFIGDAILAVFGAPIPSEQNAANAVRAADLMLTKLAEFNQRRVAAGEEPIEIGIGIHTGPVVGGNIGSSKRVEYTVIGDTVNVASRLESLTKKFPEPIVISQATYSMVKDLVEVAGVEETQLKGKSASTRIYRITGIRR